MTNLKEIFKAIKKKQQASRHNSIIQQAHSCICLDDFDNKVYIAYNGTPLIPVEDNWTQKEILNKLEDTREGYIAFRLKQTSQPVAAFW